MLDLFFHRDLEETEVEQAAAEEFQGEWTTLTPEVTIAQPEVPGWSEGV